MLLEVAAIDVWSTTNTRTPAMNRLFVIAVSQEVVNNLVELFLLDCLSEGFHDGQFSASVGSGSFELWVHVFTVGVVGP